MSTHAVVSVHEVDETGATGPTVGSGSLVHPLFVVVHAPLNAYLAQRGEAAPRLRLAIGSFNIQPVVEVVDASGVHLAEHRGDDPLVGVSLTRAASSPPATPLAPSGVVDWDTLAEAFGQKLVQARGPMRDDHGSEDEHGDADPDGQLWWVCKLFSPPPWFC